jgi:hypothetical protein
MNDCKFKLEPGSYSTQVTVRKFYTSNKKIEFQCKIKQIPVNTNDASTCHKLQGMSMDAIIVTSWPTGGLASMFNNWEYVVLSCVRTLKDLYLVESIDMEKSFKPSEQLRSYIEYARKQVTTLLGKQKDCNISY